jgi:predicted ribosome quality control (RQC) complex YloA/Tae2 family protein
MDLAILQQIAVELDRILSGGFVNKVHQPLPREMVLRIRVPAGGEKKLMLGVNPQRGRVHLTELKMPNPWTPPRFCAYLRAHFQGARILGVTCLDDDRVLRMRAALGPRDQPKLRDLVVELLGRDSNILLLDADSNTIMECLHRIPVKETGTRIVLPGTDYSLPPGRNRPNKGSGDVLTSESVRPGITVRSNGKKALTLSASSPLDEVFESANLAADAYYGEKVSTSLSESMKTGLSGLLKKKIRSLDRRIVKIAADRKRLEDLLARQEEGELLKANLRLIKKGMASVEVDDWATGSKRSIPLDPALDGVANMEKIFKKASKGKRGGRVIPQRLKRTIEEKQALEDLLFFVEQAQTMDDLNSLAEEIPSARSQRKKEAAGPTKAAGRRGDSLIREFETPTGGVALVGRSGKGNDLLLRTKAGKGDLWLHVKGMAGAHVLLPLRGRAEVPPEDTIFGAALAAEFSKAGGKGKTEVIVADVKDVARIKGALPGQVTVRKYRTIVAEGSV